MTSIIHDFRSIRRKLERQEQKAEFEEKNPKVEPSMYGWPYGVAVPFELPDLRARVVAGVQHGTECGASRLSGGSCGSVTLTLAELPLHTPSQAAGRPLGSLAHPEWPYTGTPHEWPKFKI